MSNHILTVGKRVHVTNYSPFRGMKGTIRRVNAIIDDDEEPFCFYLLALDPLREPIWFEHTEVDPLDISSSAL